MSDAIPAVVENHLDAIHCWHDGEIILGSSSLTCSRWNGSLWCFQDVNDAPDVTKCLTGTETSSGICDLICIQEHKVVVAMDCGFLEIYQLSKEPWCFTSISSSCEHDDSILSISLNANESNVISGGSDKCIKVWDAETWTAVGTYRPIHAGMVWQVACSDVESHIFLTCGQDGATLLFDLRQAKPATILGCDAGVKKPTSVAWKPSTTFVYAVGDGSGHITLKDIRQNGTLNQWRAHKKRIFRMVFSSDNHSLLASCADDTDVCVYDIGKEKAELTYRDDSHDDFIRGLTWNGESAVITCGWDKRVLKHTICEMDVVR